MSNDVFAATDHGLFFDDAVPPELCCSICCGVLKDPKDTPCGCTFCTSCISTWLAKSSTCPTDRQPLRPSLLKPPHRIVASMLSRLRLRCPHHHKGCTVILTPDTVDQHEAICIFRGSYRRAIPPRPPTSRPPTSTTTSTTSSDAAGTSTTPAAAASGSSTGPPTTTPAPVSRRRPRAPSMTNPSLGYDVSTTPISSLSSAALAAVPHAASLPGNVHVATSTVSRFPAAQYQPTAPTAAFPSFNPAITSPLFAQFSNMSISGASTTAPTEATQAATGAAPGASGEGLPPAFASGFPPMAGLAPSVSAMGAFSGAYGLNDPHHPFFRPVVYNPAVGLFGDPYACFRNAASHEIFTLGGGNASSTQTPPQQARARPVGRAATGGRRVARAAPTSSPGTGGGTPTTAQPPLSAPATAPATPTTPIASTTTTTTAFPATPGSVTFSWPSSSFNSPGVAPSSNPTTPVEPSSEGASTVSTPSFSSATVFPRTTSAAPQAAPSSSTPSGAPSTPLPQRMSFGTVTLPTPSPTTTTPQASPTPPPFSFATASPGPVAPSAASSASSASRPGVQQEGVVSAAASSATAQPLPAGGFATPSFPASSGLASAAVPSLSALLNAGTSTAAPSFNFTTPSSTGPATGMAPSTPTRNGNKRAVPNASMDAGAGTTSGSGPQTGPQADVAAPAPTDSSSSSGTEEGASTAPAFVFGRSSLPAFSLCVPDTHQPPAASITTPPPRPQASN